jgi:hypothetical protein
MVNSKNLSIPKCVIFLDNGGFFLFSIENDKLVVKETDKIVPKGKSKKSKFSPI